MVEVTSSDGYASAGDSNARNKLAIYLLFSTAGLVFIALSGSFILVYTGRTTIDNVITLILAVSSVFSGLLGSAIGYYFKA